MNEPTKPKHNLLENPTDQPLDRFVIMLDREAQELSLCQITVPAQSTVNLAELRPSIASGRETAPLFAPPGVTADEQMTVTVVVEDRQPRADGKQCIWDSSLILQPRSERTLPESDRCLYVLPGDSEPEDIQKALLREWKVVGEVTKDGTVKKKRERKKDARKAQKQAKSG